MRNYLASVEGTLTDLLLKLGVTEANRLGENDAEKRRKKLLTMARKALQTLEDGGDPSSPAAKQMYLDSSKTDTPGAPSNALSLDPGSLSAEDRAANALSHAMGAGNIPREYR